MSDRGVDSGKLIVDSAAEAAGAPHSTVHAPRAWDRFSKNQPALASAWLLSFIVLIVLAWPVCLKIAPQLGPRGLAFSQNYQPDNVSEGQFLPPSRKH